MSENQNTIRTMFAPTSTVVGSASLWVMFLLLSFFFIALEMPLAALVAIVASILSIFGISWSRTIFIDTGNSTVTAKDSRFFFVWFVRRTVSCKFEDIAGVEMESKGKSVFRYYNVFIQLRGGEKLLACNSTDKFTAHAIKDRIEAFLGSSDMRQSS